MAREVGNLNYSESQTRSRPPALISCGWSCTIVKIIIPVVCHELYGFVMPVKVSFVTFFMHGKCAAIPPASNYNLFAFPTAKIAHILL